MCVIRTPDRFLFVEGPDRERRLLCAGASDRDWARRSSDHAFVETDALQVSPVACSNVIVERDTKVHGQGWSRLPGMVVSSPWYMALLPISCFSVVPLSSLERPFCLSPASLCQIPAFGRPGPDFRSRGLRRDGGPVGRRNGIWVWKCNGGCGLGGGELAHTCRAVPNVRHWARQVRNIVGVMR